MPNPVAIDWLLPVLTAPFIGSFLGVVAERLPTGRGVVLGRSACPHCGHRLRARDLVPVLSWVASGGRCRYCAAPLGLLHPAIEIAALVIALWAASELSGWLIWAGCALGWTLLALAVIDQRHLILPDRLTLPLIPAGLGVAYAVEPSLVLNHAIGAGAGFLALAVVGWAYRRLRGREGLGLGDAKLLAAAGAWVSWPGLPSVVLLAAAAALLAAAAGSLAGRSVRLTDPVPFGSYLCLGTWLVWLYGPLGFG
jgi:leader peptidase (prepilin peptidase)/N-methyltransferase